MEYIFLIGGVVLADSCKFYNALFYVVMEISDAIQILPLCHAMLVTFQ